MNGRYERISKREVYANPWVAVEVHDIRHPNGVPGEHVLVVTPSAVGVIVADDEDLLFTRQPRFAASGDVVEIVKGGAGEGESLLEAAQRETREELGIVANTWEPLGSLYEIPSIMSTPVTLFLATGVYHVDAEPEPQETIDLVRVSKSDAFAAVAAGKINDAVTAGALLRYALLTGYLRHV